MSKAIPILDKRADPNLSFERCWGDKDLIIDWDKTRESSLVREHVVKKFKSEKSSYFNETWRGGGRDVSIERWYFDYPEDALLYPESGIPIPDFPGWSAIPPGLI